MTRPGTNSVMDILIHQKIMQIMAMNRTFKEVTNVQFYLSGYEPIVGAASDPSINETVNHQRMGKGQEVISHFQPSLFQIKFS